MNIFKKPGIKRTVKILFYLLLILIFYKSAFSQSNPSFVGIRSGASFPIAKYHASSLDLGSFAMTGFNVTAEGAWFFNPRFGVGGAFGWNEHPVDIGSLGWAKVQADPFLMDVYIRSEPYQVATTMIGMYTQLPVFGKFYFTGKILGGYLWGKTPYQLYKPTYFFTGPDYFEITSAYDWKLSWQAGIGIRYNISPCFGLVFDSDIIYDKLTFNFNTSSGVREDERIISIVNTTLGVRFNLANK